MPVHGLANPPDGLAVTFYKGLSLRNSDRSIGECDGQDQPCRIRRGGGWGLTCLHSHKCQSSGRTCRALTAPQDLHAALRALPWIWLPLSCFPAASTLLAVVEGTPLSGCLAAGTVSCAGCTAGRGRAWLVNSSLTEVGARGDGSVCCGVPSRSISVWPTFLFTCCSVSLLLHSPLCTTRNL